MNREEAKERRRQQVLDAAEAAIRREGSVDFSMRELAQSAGVSFATPFNLFGKKEDILAALFNKRITEQATQTNQREHAGSGLNLVFSVASESCDAYLSDAQLFKPLAQTFRMQSSPQLHAVANQAQAIWREALVDCQNDRVLNTKSDLDKMARQIHLSFRVAFWMWAADNLSDQDFKQQVLYNTFSILLRSATPKGKSELDHLLESDPRLAP